LQEPTRRIISFVQRLKNALTDSSTTNQEIAFTLNFIEQSALRQRALVRDIQLYLAATQPRGEIELIKVKEVLTKVLDSRLTLIKETQAVIECGQLPFVMIDRPRLYDIFSILLDNALRYNQIDCTPKIRIYGELKNNRAYYYVEDNGIGIASEYHERIFLVFERLQVSNNADSTGIGLAIFRRIIQSCNGSVNVKETLGGGTTIVFDLPTNF
jgi:light-regulated signal transduction histidine kinase (bacteriophytochrome)